MISIISFALLYQVPVVREVEQPIMSLTGLFVYDVNIVVIWEDNVGLQCGTTLSPGTSDRRVLATKGVYLEACPMSNCCDANQHYRYFVSLIINNSFSFPNGDILCTSRSSRLRYRYTTWRLRPLLVDRFGGRWLRMLRSAKAIYSSQMGFRANSSAAPKREKGGINN
jgi:hypothetical protein